MNEKNPTNSPDPQSPPPEAPDKSSENNTQQVAIEAMKKELEETQQRLLRVSADYQNFARRSQANIEAAREEQLADIAKSLLVVLDHFERALTLDASKMTTDSLIGGVKIVYDELLAALERFAIHRQIIQLGDEFVPGKHEAVMQQPVKDMKPGHVAAVMQTGYEIGERVLRPAKVSVSQ